MPLRHRNGADAHFEWARRDTFLEHASRGAVSGAEPGGSSGSTSVCNLGATLGRTAVGAGPETVAEPASAELCESSRRVRRFLGFGSRPMMFTR